MKLEAAQYCAQRIVRSLSPFCQRIEVAGSVRRQCPDVGDLDIVVVPKWEQRPDSMALFDDMGIPVNMVFEWCQGNTDSPERPEIRWEGRGLRQWTGYLPDFGIKLELWITLPENWGTIFLIRTGSAEFAHALVTFAWQEKKRFQDRFLWDTAREIIIPTYEELDVFNALRLDYVEPQCRTGPESILRRGLPMYRTEGRS
jgi:DNA polymerase/3'-5' exonuclease PolX